LASLDWTAAAAGATPVDAADCPVGCVQAANTSGATVINIFFVMVEIL
jgi:hypothetical protein